METANVKVTAGEFQNILNTNKFKGDFDKYEIIPDFPLTGNKIIDSCLHTRLKDDGSTLYFGGHTYGDCYNFQNMVNKTHKTTSLFVDGYRAVLTDNETYNIYTYCEGDISVNSFSSIEDYQVGIAEAVDFYEKN